MFVPRQDLYTIKIIEETVIIVESFGHIARHCRNQRIVGQEKRISYQNNDRD